MQHSHVTLVTLPAAALDVLRVPEAEAEIFSKTGIPRELFGRRFKASSSLDVLQTPCGPVVKFGTSGLLSAICLDPGSLRVLSVVGRNDCGRLVNTTLRQFVDTACVVASHFPFHPKESTYEEICAASDRLGNTIREIDPAAIGVDHFWSTMLDDICMGDFDIESMGIVDQLAEEELVKEGGGEGRG